MRVDQIIRQHAAGNDIDGVYALCLKADDWNEWLEAHSREIVADRMSYWRSHTRQAAKAQGRRVRRARSLGRKVKETARGMLDMPIQTTPAGDHRALSTLTGFQALSAKVLYIQRAASNQHMADFLGAIGQRAGRKRVGTVFTNDDLIALAETFGVSERDAA